MNLLPRLSAAFTTILALVPALAAAQDLRLDQNSLPSPAWSATERWVWTQLLDDGQNAADLEDYCRSKDQADAVRLDPRHDGDQAWRNPCRIISARFLRDILTRSPWRDALPSRGVGIASVKVLGSLSLDNAKLSRAFWLGLSRIEGDVTLVRTRTDSMIGLIGTVVTGEFIGDGLQTDTDLQLRGDTEFRRNVSLNQARINGILDMTDTKLVGTLSLQGVRVFDVFLRSSTKAKAPASFAGGSGVEMTLAKITNRLDFRGAILGDVNLSGATIAGDLVLGTQGSFRTEWKRANGTAAKLDLRNAQVGNLQDEETAWPGQGYLLLQGFSFAHLSGAAGKSGMLHGHEDPDWWARLDQRYSVTPYTQLAAALAAMGDRGAARRIQFLARQRARDADWQSGSWPAWFGQTFLLGVAGYGIGGYTFIVLVWVCGLSLAGALVLALTVPDAMDKDRGAVWCFGASLSRLLPVIEINKEFTDYFNDPKRERLKQRWQQLFFDCLGVIGWVLGALLIAALSGLTQNP